MKIADVSWECSYCHRIGSFRVFGIYAHEPSLHHNHEAAMSHMSAMKECAAVFGAEGLVVTVSTGEFEWPK